jgi:hypothetical protein
MDDSAAPQPSHEPLPVNIGLSEQHRKQLSEGLQRLGVHEKAPWMLRASPVSAFVLVAQSGRRQHAVGTRSHVEAAGRLSA